MHTKRGTDVQYACDSLTWIDGITYYASNNSVTYVLTNSTGCDSVVTLNLTLHHSDSVTDVQIACDDLTWIDGNNYTSTNSSAIHTLTNIFGCDSVVSLDLTIKNSSSSTIPTQHVIVLFGWMGIIIRQVTLLQPILPPILLDVTPLLP
ncbi:MAG: hypothetical protein IPO32_03735 [Crocinitomicaceae bacterium]|nr:hypothetical protein [Crocinitomicaceae bacterium]